MKKVSFAFCGVLVLALSGCTSKLAERELGNEEKAWNDYLHPMYPGWEAPATLPPAVVNKEAEAQRPFRDGAPEAPQVEEVAVDIDIQDDAVPGIGITDTAEVKYDEYTVQKNESLSIIAKKVYGNGRKYYRIQKANEDVVKNPNKLYPGMKLRIPRP